MKQVTFASLAYDNKRKKTRKELFLSEMEQVVPWKRLMKKVDRHYAKGKGGRPPMPLEMMLRIYLMQQWFSLSDPAMEDALYDIESMRRFAGIDLSRDRVPDETTILNFRHLLETHRLTEKFFDAIGQHLDALGLTVQQGTLVDATLISAPSSTKNEKKQRDPEMSQTKKGNQYYFGMKAHIGVDKETRLVHTVVTTTASVHDSSVMEDLLYGDETEVYGDKGYAKDERREKYAARGVAWHVSHKARRGQALTARQKKENKRHNKVRAFVEHPFHVLKCLWRYTKVRYKGLTKNSAQLFTLFGLANLYLARRKIIARQAQCAC
jgi:IS5 family transposase